MSEEEKIPPFVQDYLDKMDYEDYADFVKLSRDYYQQREEYPGKYATQSAYLNNYNRTAGKNHQLDYDKGLSQIDADYRREAYRLAKQHGFTGPDPNQPSDKEFTKQGEKFQGMIDRAKERQQEQTRQPEPKQSSDNVQQKPSSTGQEDREQQRAAFLEKVKQTRELQMQWQQNKEPEI